MKEMVLSRTGILLIVAPLSKHSIITKINFTPVKISRSHVTVSGDYFRRKFLFVGLDLALHMSRKFEKQ